METLPVDLTSLVASIMGMLLVLIPVLGLAVLVEALVATRGEGAGPTDLAALKARIEVLEHEVKDLNGSPARPALPESRPIPLRP